MPIYDCGAAAAGKWAGILTDGCASLATDKAHDALRALVAVLEDGSRSEHVAGSGAAISAPATAWIAYGFVHLTGISFDPLGNPAWLVTGFSALIVIYGAIAFGICVAIGGN